MKQKFTLFSGFKNDYNFVLVKSKSNIYYVGQYVKNKGEFVNLKNARMITSVGKISLSQLISDGKCDEALLFFSNVYPKTELAIDMILSLSQDAVYSLYNDLGHFKDVCKKYNMQQYTQPVPKNSCCSFVM